jgi:two-component system, sensor histidine kinase YesM
MYSNSQIALEQIDQNIQSKVNLIESVNENITYNERFQNFLGSNFKDIPFSIDEYSQYIVPLIQYAVAFQKVNINDINVFMSNSTIPEGYGVFFHDTKIKDRKWLTEFINSDEKSIWTTTSKFSFADTYNKSFSTLFVHAQKIEDFYGNYLGLVAISVRPNDLFSSIANSSLQDSTTFVLGEDNELLFSTKHNSSLNKSIDNGYFINAPNWDFKDNHLYVYKNINDINLKIGMLIPNFKEDILTIPITLTIYIAALLILLFAFYILIRLVFSNIYKNLKSMDKSIQEDFNVRIPIDRKDEFGQIGEKFNILLDKINALVKDIIKKETAHKDAQLKALQFQINPHFIYNTMDIFASKLELSGNYEVAESIVDFSKMLRYNMSTKSIYTTVFSELEYVKNYISLQKIKYDNRINLYVNLPDKLYNFKIIKFLLQPVVENSLRHGMTTDMDKLDIAIDFHIISTEQFQIVITDNGIGIEMDKLSQINEQFITSQYNEELSSKTGGIGLQNINERLKLFYGSKYHIRLESENGQYMRAILTFPILVDQE